MKQNSTSERHHQLRIAIFGMLVLALGMGIGRFLFTPMLPVMLNENQFTFVQLSWIASSNYAGYLIGSLLFSFGFFHSASRTRLMLSISAVATGGLILAMALFMQPTIVIFIRFLAGVASAGTMIFGSMIVLQNTRSPVVIASLFAGVGTGIFIGNEYVIVGLLYMYDANTLWLGAAAISGLLLIMLVVLLPSGSSLLSPTKNQIGESQIMHWWQLAILYGLAGFGYIIVATYLPLMAKDAGIPLLTEHLWSLVGLSIIPGCYGWLWAARRWGILKCLTANLLIQGICVLLTLFSNIPLLLTLSCIGFGATFMGTTSLAMSLAKQLYVSRNINLLGVVTLTYGIGQIIGPLLTSVLSVGSDAVMKATACGAVALFIAAGISQYQFYKSTRLY
ncbi:MFS transporter [Xenorhabdus khoisanae]|uniref:MFS transporter n=1 Tax=Xenorhabdus khoisanae TaxID=880157 RepID=UPI0032B71616